MGLIKKKEGQEKTKDSDLKFEISIDGKDYKAVLRKPLFTDYRMASLSLQSNTGKLDILAAGSSIIQYCWKSGSEELKNGDETDNPEIAKAYMNFCTAVYNKVFNETRAEIKKN